MIKRQAESGEVAMLMVGIFTAVFSVLAIGLSYVMVNTVRNSKNDTLSYNARAAAESGVEDAKRFLKYCYMNDFGHIDKKSVAYSRCDVMYSTNKTMATKDQNCNGLLNKMEDMNSTDDGFNLNFEHDNSGNLLVPVGKRYAGGKADSAIDKNKENLQYYQCLKINTLTRSYEGALLDMSTGGRSVVVPLRLVNDDRRRTKAKTIIISWHDISDKPEGDGMPIQSLDNVTLPPLSKWASGSGGVRPAVLRAQFVPVAKRKIKLDDMLNDSRAITLRPTSQKTDEGEHKVGANFDVDETITVVNPTPHEDDSDLKSVGRPLKIEDYKMSTEPNKSQRPPLAGVVCKPDGDGNGTYACAVAFQFSDAKLFDTDEAGHDWFLRVNSVYGSTHFRVTAYDKYDKPLWFDGVQPSVDVTGKSAESYVRIHARVEPVNQDKTGLGNWWPEYAIETKGDICKNLVIKRNKGEIYCKSSGE